MQQSRSASAPDYLRRAQASGAGGPDTPYRLHTARTAQTGGAGGSTHGCGAVDCGECTGCSIWQRRYAALQEQHSVDAAAALMVPFMRAKIGELTQHFSEARREAASLAANLDQNRQACADLRCQLSARRAHTSAAQQPYGVIPLSDYLDLSSDILLCTEQIQAMSLASSGSSSASDPLPAHQNRLTISSQTEAENSQKTEHMDTRAEPGFGSDCTAEGHIKASSIAGSEASCGSGRECRGAADVDSMLQALEAVLQAPASQGASLKSSYCYSYRAATTCRKNCIALFHCGASEYKCKTSSFMTCMSRHASSPRRSCGT